MTIGLPFVMIGRLYVAKKFIELKAVKLQNSRERQPLQKRQYRESARRRLKENSSQSFFSARDKHCVAE